MFHSVINTYNSYQRTILTKDNNLCFDYEDFNKATVNLFLDCVYGVNEDLEELDFASLLELGRFCAFEGKASTDGFENDIAYEVYKTYQSVNLSSIVDSFQVSFQILYLVVHQQICMNFSHY